MGKLTVRKEEILGYEKLNQEYDEKWDNFSNIYVS